ncbi:MAG: sigma 54-interacting transcriptional regulator [Pyrinomonadaceae bacterium]
MKEPTILVVDDERLIRWTLTESLRGWGYAPVEAADASAALRLFDSEQPAAVLLDINLPDRSGLDVLREMRRREPQAVVIMVTAAALFENAVAALRSGAYDFVGKPINLEELRVTLRNALEAGRMRRELSTIRGERARKFGFEQIVGDSPAMRAMIAIARKVAASEVSSVLLQGKSGTGKDMVAKAIHYVSRRSEGPFVAVNCAAIPSTLIESELFGYEKGAFTDAKARKEGLFEQAEGGTLFLDEIGELELGLQAKLLRVLDGLFAFVGVLTPDGTLVEANLTRVFSPFYTTTEGGTGLGLPSVRRIAQAHGGRVEVSSERGRGSTFAVHPPTRWNVYDLRDTGRTARYPAPVIG